VTPEDKGLPHGLLATMSPEEWTSADPPACKAKDRGQRWFPIVKPGGARCPLD